MGFLWGPMGSYDVPMGFLWGPMVPYGVGAVLGPFVGFLWGFFGVWGGHLEGDLCGHGDPTLPLWGPFGVLWHTYGVFIGSIGWGPFRGRLWDFGGVFLGCGGVTLKGISVVMVTL